MHRSEDGGQFVTWPKLPVQPATSPTRPDIVSGHTLMAVTDGTEEPQVVDLPVLQLG